MSNDLEALLGPGYCEFTKEVDGRRYRGHMCEKGMPFQAAVSRVHKHRELARKRKLHLFAGHVDHCSVEPPGKGVLLYAVRGISAPEVADLADVAVRSKPGVNTAEGWRAAIESLDSPLARAIKSGEMTIGGKSGVYAIAKALADPDPVNLRAKARKFFSSVYNRCPYEIYYADMKGCRAKFLNPVTPSDAALLERKILHFNPEAMDLLQSGTLRADIARRGEMRLWWD